MLKSEHCSAFLNERTYFVKWKNKLTDSLRKYIRTLSNLNGKVRRGGREAEGAALEKRNLGNTGIVGSNPTLSARVGF